MKSETTVKRAKWAKQNSPSGNSIYFFGMIGTIIFYWQRADTFWMYVLAFLKGFVWPAVVVYRLLESIVT